jgi:3-phenylpropionate/trans-cinnamate dioxygenase ferredoxin reductase subunit
MGVNPATVSIVSRAMATERIVIVGGGAGGLATARAYREHGGAGHVTLLGEEPRSPYQRPPLTKDFLRGELDVEELPLEEEQWFEEHEIELRLGTRVSAIDPAAGAVTVNGSRLEADAIVLATGSEPLRPDLPGMDHPALVTMRNLPDSIRLAEQARIRRPMLVLGTGFIGCEIAASLAMLDAHVTLVGQESLPQAKRLGDEAAERIAGWLEELDVRLVANATVSAIHDGRTLELEDGSFLDGACVVLGMGVRPRVELAEQAGMRVHDGVIPVDTQMRASDGSGKVFAVGDIACAENVSAGRHLRVEHWGDALEHGEIAGRALAGENAHWKGVPGFWSTIGPHTLKYAAWGGNYHRARLVEHFDGGFTVWYSQEDGAVVGVLAHNHDTDYEQGRELIRRGGTIP